MYIKHTSVGLAYGFKKLCHSTRLQVKTLLTNVIEVTIFTGCDTEETLFLPKIPFIPSDYHFQFKQP